MRSRATILGQRPSDLFLGALTVWAAIPFAIAYSNYHALQYPFDYEDYSNFKVDYPYRSRVLMAFLFRCALWIGRHFGRMHDDNLSRGPLWICHVTVIVLSLSVTVWAIRKSIQALLGKETPFAWCALLAFYLCASNMLLIGELRVQSPYDLPSLAFYSVALMAILRKNRILYYLTFIIGSFNRETTLFLPLFFFLSQLDTDVPLFPAIRRLPLSVWGEVVLQVATWKVIRMICDHIAGKGHIAPFSLFIHFNGGFLLNPGHWPLLSSVFGFMWIPYFIFFRKIPSIFLRRCVLLIPAWLLIMFLVGDLLELRIHNEWIPYFTICIVLIVSRYVKVSDSDSVATEAPGFLL